MADKKIILEHDGLDKFIVNYRNPYTERLEKYVFPPYVKGSKRPRRLEVSEECYYYLKDETTTFAEGFLRVVVDDVPAEKKQTQIEASEEVVETIPEYEENILTKEDVEKIMKGTKASIAKRLSKITTQAQKDFFVQIVKDLEIKNIDKLREVVKVLYGEDVEFEYIFPVED